MPTTATLHTLPDGQPAWVHGWTPDAPALGAVQIAGLIVASAGVAITTRDRS